MCPPTSRLGTLYRYGAIVLGEQLNHGSTDEEVLGKLTRWVNQRTGSVIKPADVVALRSEYWWTKPGKENQEVIKRYIDNLESR